MKKSELKQIIKEEILKEFNSNKDIAMTFNMLINDLEDTLKNIKNPEKWIEKLGPRNAKNVLDSLEKIIAILERVR